MSNFLVFRGSLDNVEKVFFYFQNIATRGKSSADLAVKLIGYFSGEAFSLYYEANVENTKRMAASKDYATVKETSITRFRKVEALKEKIQRTILSSLDSADLRSSLRALDSLF